MDFEFDATKSRAHQLKHGIDFNKAQALWDDYNYIELPARIQGEPRWLVGRDVRFDEGEDITAYLDMDKARRPAREQHRVNVDFPAWMVDALDDEAKRLGITRQAVIKVWLADRLEQRGDSAA